MKENREIEYGFGGFLKKLQKFSLKFHSIMVIIGGMWLLLTMLQVFFDVTGRYVFSKPMPGTFAIGVIMLVFLVYMGATYTEATNGHVRVSIISDRFTKKWQNVLNILFLIAGITVLPLLTWQTFLTAMYSWGVREVALDYPIPIYPGKFVIAVGFFFLSIQYLLNLVIRIYESIKPKTDKQP